MKKISTTSLGAFITALLCIQFVSAQPANPPATIMIFGCNLAEGKDMSDVQAFNDNFNAWADANGVDELNVSMLTPVLYSDQMPWDVLYIDRWASGAAFGANFTTIMSAAGNDMVSEFTDTFDCGSQTLFLGILASPPTGRGSGAPIQFLNCTVKEGQNNSDGIAALTAWGNATSDSGTGHAAYIPLQGENPDASYNFKWVILHQSWQGYGNSLDALFNGGNGQLFAQTINPVMDCDSARLYNQTTIREMSN